MVAATPALIDRMRAARTWGSLNATENQWNVNPASGQLCTVEESNAKIMMVRMGRARKRSTPTTHSLSTHRVPVPTITWP